MSAIRQTGSGPALIGKFTSLRRTGNFPYRILLIIQPRGWAVFVITQFFLLCRIAKQLYLPSLKRACFTPRVTGLISIIDAPENLPGASLTGEELEEGGGGVYLLMAWFFSR